MEVDVPTSRARRGATDVELLHADDARSFRNFFDRHVAGVHGYVVMRIGPGAAEDIVSETFAIAWRRRLSFRTDATSGFPWLLGIASNVLLRHREAEARWHASVAAGSQEAVAPAGAVHAADTDHIGLHRALARLSPNERDVLLLVSVAELSVTEAASQLGIAATAARVRLHRARRRMSAELEGWRTR